MTADLTPAQRRALESIAATGEAGAHHNPDGARFGRSVARNSVLATLGSRGLVARALHSSRIGADLATVCRNGAACQRLVATTAGRAVLEAE